jgi:tRNA pseudouridine32 synthase/23S rRNA pseudouridine746 synthase
MIIKKKIVAPILAVDFIAAETGLSKSLIKKVMEYGAFWVKRAKDKNFKRYRRAKADLIAGDMIEFYYDPEVINAQPEENPEKIYSSSHYSIWYKPVGYLSQGSLWGDHLAMDRYIERYFPQTWLLHRLDREVSGLMVFSHTKGAASYIGKLIQDRKLTKIYQGIVKGKFPSDIKEINLPLDDQEAKTLVKILEVQDDRTVLELELITGRFHQIRRHLAGVGFPLIGDPKYGEDNKNTNGLMLSSVKIFFHDVFKNKDVSYSTKPHWELS